MVQYTTEPGICYRLPVMGDVRPRIAVIDDDLSVRRALERLLRASGYDAAVFASGHEFFYSLEDRTPDCLILDLHMPGMNGLEVQRRLRETGVRLPVVVITGHDEPQTRTQCLDAGAAAYLCKPLNDEALIAAIQGAITAAV
ncbi:MAG TPA: response regulator [Verrucomicrobiae bacterium]|nr:response regulator [Verrucomicrobiae bacterium]